MGTATTPKEITLNVAGAEGRSQQIRLLPGVTAGDILRRLGLNEHQLNKPDGGVFAMDEDVYSGVSNGDTLYASRADVEAGV